MAITRAKKEEIVHELQDAFKKAASVVFVNFKGLKVSDTTAMRRGLGEDGVSYTVAKKSLTKRALEGQKLEGDLPELPGELSLAWGDDLVAPARGVYNFVKKFPENLMILGGIFDGRYMSKEELEGIATIPPTPVLRGMFVNIINSPIQRMAIALSEVAKKKA